MSLTRVHIITGSLGVGKTTAIRHLLRERPALERWAVLVNEWGEIGIDGALLQGSDNGVEVREIAGGCICCSSGPQLRLALNRLLATEPQRIFIEPSGLAAPARLIDLLRQAPFASRVDLAPVITLVNAADFVAGNWRGQDTLADQIRMADILVASKNELNPPALRGQFATAARQLYPPPLFSAAIEHGAVPLSWLDACVDNERVTAPTDDSPRPVLLHARRQAGAPMAASAGTRRRASHRGSTHACGWIVPADHSFTLADVQRFFEGLPAWAAHHGGQLLRAKGVFRCGHSWWLFDWADHTLSREALAWRRDSRWEILMESGNPVWDELEDLPGRSFPTGEQADADIQ